MSAQLFPVFLKLDGRKVVVVGGGRVAASRLPALVAGGAEVTVVAPDVRPEILAASRVTIRSRAFEPPDLQDAWLVVAAASPAVNRVVAEAAEKRRVFVNAVDDPASASAYTARVFRRGEVTIAISTGGAAPALAGLLRQGLDALVPDEIETWVAEARCLKKEQRATKVVVGAR